MSEFELTPASVRAALVGHFSEQPTRDEIAVIEKGMNTEIAANPDLLDCRVRLRNDGDNRCIVGDVRWPGGLRDQFSVSWDEAMGVEPEPVAGVAGSEEEWDAARQFAEKTEKQWELLKQSTRDEWLVKWRLSKQTLVGSDKLDADYEISGVTVQAGEIVRAAFDEFSKADPEQHDIDQWNNLDEDDRDVLILEALEKMQSEAQTAEDSVS